jgi:hypothetical protein
MAEFCLQCCNEINDTNETEDLFIFDDDICEHCGAYKPCIVRYKMPIGERFYRKIYILSLKNKFLFIFCCLFFFPVLLYLKHKYN